MKCSLKDGFISILLIIFIAPSKGIEFPLLLHADSLLGKPMNFQQFKAAINRLQDLDSFPDIGDCENKLHKIVKKQMDVSDSKELKKNKRSVLSVSNWSEIYGRAAREGDDVSFKDEEKTKYTAPDFGEHNNQQEDDMKEGVLVTLKDTLKGKQFYFINRMDKKILLRKIEEKKAKAKNRLHPISSNYLRKEYKIGAKPKCLLSIKPISDNPINKNPEQVYSPVREKQNIFQAAVKEKYFSDIPIKKEQDAAKVLMQDTTNAVSTPIKENPIANKNAFKEKEYSLGSAAVPTEMKTSQMNSFLKNECKANPFGCIHSKHKRRPEEQFFPHKYSDAKNPNYGTVTTLTNSQIPALNISKEPSLALPKDSTTSRLKKVITKTKRMANITYSQKTHVFDTSEDLEPSNEWVDASQNPIQKVPPEFKPKKVLGLKIYHLCSERSINELLRNTKTGRVLEKFYLTNKMTKRDLVHKPKSTVKRNSFRQHHPRSFVIHIKKKSEKDQDPSITESEENNEDDETDEDDEEEDSEDEDDETEDEVIENLKEKSSTKDSLKELFKSAKAAVTNRVRFNDPTLSESDTLQKQSGNTKSKKSEQSSDAKEKKKKVLIDANIKVDSTIGSALKCILKGKTRENKEIRDDSADNEALVSDRGSQDQLDPELIRMYEHLIRNNPRVKRYFLANYSEKGN